MQNYTFSFRRRFWFKNLKKCVGHRLDVSQNKMVVYFSNGSLREIKNWIDCEAKLGADWVLWTKNAMEKESGTSVKMNIE